MPRTELWDWQEVGKIEFITQLTIEEVRLIKKNQKTKQMYTEFLLCEGIVVGSRDTTLGKKIQNFSSHVYKYNKWRREGREVFCVQRLNHVQLSFYIVKGPDFSWSLQSSHPCCQSSHHHNHIPNKYCFFPLVEILLMP